jgi:hypothetical protein
MLQNASYLKGMFRKALLPLVIGMLLAGCGANPGASTPVTGRVTGHVMLRACGGANRAGQTSCPLTAVSGALVSFQATGGTPQTASTDSGGAFRIELSPASYAIKVTLTRSSAPLPAAFADAMPQPAVAGPTSITVVAGKSVAADFTYTIQLL